MLYADYNATAPVPPSVREAMLPFLSDEFGNASSIYALGRRAKDAVEQAREHVAGLVNCRPSQLVFMGSGTEACFRVCK